MVIILFSGCCTNAWTISATCRFQCSGCKSVDGNGLLSCQFWIAGVGEAQTSDIGLGVDTQLHGSIMQDVAWIAVLLKTTNGGSAWFWNWEGLIQDFYIFPCFCMDNVCAVYKMFSYVWQMSTNSFSLHVYHEEWNTHQLAHFSSCANW
jgi:hypothetical protein